MWPSPRSTAIEFQGAPDAEAVDLTACDRLRHEGRRQHDKAHVLVGIDAARCHPEAELVVVGRERERHRKGQRLRATLAACRHHA
jgi:hypothetical protein